MSQIRCPLCCRKKHSRSSLRNHLKHLLENITCPFCNVKLVSINELYKHLEVPCMSDIHEQETYEEAEEKPNDRYYEDSSVKVEPDDNKNDKYVSKEEDDEMGEDADEAAEEEVEDNEVTEVYEYFCELCNVNFSDVQDHLENFHPDQEVVVEQTTEHKTVDAAGEEEIYIQAGASENEEEEEEEERFRDKSGHLYARKMVKVDQAWLKKQYAGSCRDKAQRFVIVDGKICKADSSDEEYEDDVESATSKGLDCSQCSKSFSDSKLLREHAKLHMKKSLIMAKQKPAPSSGGSHSCPECNTTFTSFKSLRLHKRMHEPVKSREVDAPVDYGLVANEAITKESLEEEEMNKRDAIRETFHCDICDKTYDKQYEDIHRLSHSEDNKGYNCEVCNRKFKSHSSLTMHSKAHTNNKKFTCSYCRKPFVTYEALTEHLEGQCQKREYACQFCGRRFSRPHEKVKHERIHTGEKPHVCDICGKAFRVSYCLTLHLRTHSGSRPYQCKECLKRFKSHSVYNHHMKTHSDVRKYQCPYCPKAFKTGVQLAGHKNSHTKPFSCTECNRPFASLYAVRAHMESHKKDNNLKYDCWICGALYSRTFALKDHMKQQHQHDADDKSKSLYNVDEEVDAANAILEKDDEMMIDMGEATAGIEVIESESQ